MLIAIVAILIALIGGAFGAVRLAKHDPDAWHVDPLTAPSPSSPNSHRVGPAEGALGATVAADGDAPVVGSTVAELAAAFDSVATGSPRVEIVAGSAADGHVTYVQRSATVGYPDYISVRFFETEDGSATFAAFSRSRYGHSDLGVNEKRLTDWVARTVSATS